MTGDSILRTVTYIVFSQYYKFYDFILMTKNKIENIFQRKFESESLSSNGKNYKVKHIERIANNSHIRVLVEKESPLSNGRIKS